jgi:hypothetical protein
LLNRNDYHVDRCIELSIFINLEKKVIKKLEFTLSLQVWATCFEEKNVNLGFRIGHGHLFEFVIQTYLNNSCCVCPSQEF